MPCPCVCVCVCVKLRCFCVCVWFCVCGCVYCVTGWLVPHRYAQPSQVTPTESTRCVTCSGCCFLVLLLLELLLLVLVVDWRGVAAAAAAAAAQPTHFECPRAVCTHTQTTKSNVQLGSFPPCLVDCNWSDVGGRIKQKQKQKQKQKGDGKTQGSPVCPTPASR